jgi:hypothetical protein
VNNHILVMNRASSSDWRFVGEDQSVEELRGRPLSELTAAGEVANEDSQPPTVRETQRLFRLRAARFLAVVAADTEDEARSLAACHDALGGDWRNPEFASSEFEDTGEAHVVGDVAISAHAALPVRRSKSPDRRMPISAFD